MIRGANAEWSLAPFHGFMSCVLPAYFVHGQIGGRIDFPTWLGQNSKSLKCKRLIQRITCHSHLQTSTTTHVMRTEILSFIAQKVISDLNDGRPQAAIDLLDGYSLTKDDFDDFFELLVGGPEMLKSIPTAVKTSFTRLYNKSSHRLPYSLDESAPVRKLAAAEIPDELKDSEEIEDASSESEEERYVPPKSTAKRVATTTATRGRGTKRGRK